MTTTQYREFEPFVKQIVDAYPESIEFTVERLSPSYIRQLLREAFRLILENEYIDTEVDRARASLVYHRHIFSDYGNKVYIGPRRKKHQRVQSLILPAETSSQTIAPIDCSNQVIFDALLTLKNADALSVPIYCLNLTPNQIDLALASYPNIAIEPSENMHILL